VKTALVLGSAASVYGDAKEAFKLFTPQCVAATNNIGIDWPSKIDHWFTLHPNKTPDWPGMEEALRRRKLARRNRPETWSFKPAPSIDHVIEDWSGSSGLFAVKALIEELQFDKIVLAGVPMTKVGGHYNEKHEWHKAEMYHRGWKKHLLEIKPFVRSMSGWTKEILGEPTRAWLTEPVPRRRT